MRKRACGAASILFSLSVSLAVDPSASRARAQQLPPAGTGVDADTSLAAPIDLQLEVFVNGRSTRLIAGFIRDGDGALAIAPDQLRNVGIIPAAEAVRADGLVDISKLPGVTYRYDATLQAIYFDVQFDSISARTIDAHKLTRSEPGEEKADSSFGGLVNYTIYGNTGGGDAGKIWDFQGLSGWFEGRVFSPYGVLSSSQLLSTSTDDRYNSTRLETNWSYSDPDTMTTYQVGDLITGGLGWTRPIRMGGVQVKRNFGLRPDLVTMPLPQLSGSAAVPSTVDVYIDNARRLSETVPEGPFEIINLPVVTGAGMARVVVRDALGRETTSDTPFFASSNLLATGLADYSLEAGYARRFYGTESNDYSSDLVGSGTLRYGVDDWLTVETHAEGGGGLLNGGGGAAFGLGSYGVASLAGSASSYGDRTGFQLAGSVEMEFGDWRLYARSQHTFGDYDDIAAITFDPATPEERFRASPPRALNQIALSVPLNFDPSTLNLSFTNVETVDGDRSQLVGLSYSRQINNRVSFFASGFTDLADQGSFGIFAGLSVQLGKDIYGAGSVSSGSDGSAFTADIAKSAGTESGSLGWRLRNSEGTRTHRSATVTYRTETARFEAGAAQHGEHLQATGQVDGAIVFAGGDVFLSNRIDDAFAVVDTGAPGVDVLYENRPFGRSNGRGKLLLPNLRSYEPNRVTIDPTNLPVDAVVAETKSTTIPADRSGTVIRFDVETQAAAALVTLRDEGGSYVEIGSTGRVEDSGEEFFVGYDGQAFLTHLKAHNRVTISRPDGSPCIAEFGFRPKAGEQVTIPDVVCRATQ